MSLSVQDIVIEQYFFTSIDVTAHLDHEADEESFTKFTCEDELNLMEDGNVFSLAITISSNDEESINAPYTFDISAFGLFRINKDEFDYEEAKEACSIIGRQILVGAAREQLAIITSRGPWNSVQLNAVMPSSRE